MAHVTEFPNFALCALPLAGSAPDNSGSGIREGAEMRRNNERRGVRTIH